MDKDVVVVDRVNSGAVTVSDQTQHVVVAPLEQNVVAEVKDISVVALGQQGPPGATGDAGGTATKIAIGNMSGHRAVACTGVGVLYADNRNLTPVFGVSTSAALDGGFISVTTHGEIEEPSWNWTAGLPIYLGQNGALIQSEPVAPALVSLRVGFALSPTRMLVSVGTAVSFATPNIQTISADVTLTATYNYVSAGPITIANGVTVTVPDGCTWVIV